MKTIILATIAALFPIPAFAKGGGALPAPCAIATPAQATAAGLTKQIRCNTFSTNQKVDTNQTQSPGFDWYTASAQINNAASIPANFSNDGTGITEKSASSFNAVNSFSTIGRQTTPPYWVGTQIRGSFYAQIDFKFSPILPTSSPGNWPAWWTADSQHALNGALIPANFPYAEFDILECFASGSAGSSCTPNQQIHIWKDVSGTNTNTCSSPFGATLPGGIDLTAYHTYGLKVLKSQDNGGTGAIEWWVDGTLERSCSYTATTQTCTAGGMSGSACVSSDLYDSLNQQDITFIISAGYPNWPVTARNFAVWQLP